MSFWNTMDSYGEMVFVTIKFVGIRWDKMGKARCFVFFDCITHSYRCDICCFLNRWAGESCLMQTAQNSQNASKCRKVSHKDVFRTVAPEFSRSSEGVQRFDHLQPGVFSDSPTKGEPLHEIRIFMEENGAPQFCWLVYKHNKLPSGKVT